MGLVTPSGETHDVRVPAPEDRWILVQTVAAGIRRDRQPESRGTPVATHDGGMHCLAGTLVGGKIEHRRIAERARQVFRRKAIAGIAGGGGRRCEQPAADMRLERLDTAERAHRPERLNHAVGVGDCPVAVERSTTDRDRELNGHAGHAPGRAIHHLESAPGSGRSSSGSACCPSPLITVTCAAPVGAGGRGLPTDESDWQAATTSNQVARCQGRLRINCISR